MSKPAARLTDLHTCPMFDGPKPHVGGPVTGPGAPTVLIGGLPAAVMGDMCTCVGPPDTIILGSTGVMICGKPAARMGDSTSHGGIITLGCPTVLIGEAGGGGGGGAAAGPGPQVTLGTFAQATPPAGASAASGSAPASSAGAPAAPAGASPQAPVFNDTSMPYIADAMDAMPAPVATQVKQVIGMMEAAAAANAFCEVCAREEEEEAEE